MITCISCGHKAVIHDSLASNPVKWKCSAPGCNCTMNPVFGPSIEQLLTNAEANLEIYGTTIKAGVEQPFHLPPCLEQALKDVQDALAKIRSTDPIHLR